MVDDNFLEGIKNSVHRAVSEGIDRGAGYVLNSARDKCPVGEYGDIVSFTAKDGKNVEFMPKTGKTGGTLRNSLKIKRLSDRCVSVGTNVEYGAYAEYGHRIVDKDGHTKGYAEEKPYLRPALEENKDKVAEAVMQMIEEIL